MTKPLDDIKALFNQAGLKGKQLKTALRELVRDTWPDLPPWTTLDAPVIEEVQKASVGSGVVLVFEEGGVRKAVLARAGDHYRERGSIGPMAPSYMILGGFINLSGTPGSSLVPASPEPEDPRIGTAREIEEEFKKPDGAPLLRVDPARLKPMDTKTLTFRNGEKHLVVGLMLELAPDEVKTVKEHAARIACDPEYMAACAGQTANSETGLPEVCGISIVPLEDAAQGKCRLLHEDQQSLFEIVHAHFAEKDAPRCAPTRAYQKKVKTLEELRALAAQWRAEGAGAIGMTSGAFDIVHPGHISFLEDASRQCDRLIAIIASDRTVKAQKGAEKPYITELKRAQTVAALGTVDAVIVSDELYHETILKALRPEILFKGDDYAGRKIMGAELAGKTVLIPCAEKEFYSSSQFVKKIKAGSPDKPPAWKPG
jgi:D-beta-D-heptose 7-phosphate kinase/D-beta-D-heptose 1-phosphate adenosyltransferase